MALQAIQTRFNGHLFRSRLEARWAVFFTALGLEYRYEPEGFDLDGLYYLPDFYLPSQNLWVEIKPTALKPGSPDHQKAVAFARAIEARAIEAWEESRIGDYPEYLVLAGDCWPDGLIVHEGAHLALGIDPCDRYSADLIVCPLCGRLIYGCVLGQRRERYSRSNKWSYDPGPLIAPGTPLPEWQVQCMWCDVRDRNWAETEQTRFYKGLIITTDDPRVPTDFAFDMARGERFGT